MLYKTTQNLFLKFLPLCTPCLFSNFLNEDIVEFVKPDRICSLTFAVDEFSVLVLYPTVFLLHNQDLQN